jgi:hypothetical protein
VIVDILWSIYLSISAYNAMPEGGGLADSEDGK